MLMLVIQSSTAGRRHAQPAMQQEVFLTPGYLAVATEYADGGGLADFQQRVENAGGMAEGPARALFQQMALALAFCHARGVTLGGFDLRAWLLDRAPARPILTRQQSTGVRGHAYFTIGFAPSSIYQPNRY